MSEDVKDMDLQPADVGSKKGEGYIKELRAENRDWRLKYQEATEKAQLAEQKAKEVESKLSEAAEKKAADVEAKLSRKLEIIEKTAVDRIIRAELKAAAAKYGLKDLEDSKLADLDKVEINAEGDVRGVDEAIGSLKDRKPYLFEAASTGLPMSGAPSPLSGQEPRRIGQGGVFDLPPDEWQKVKQNAKNGNFTYK